MQKRFFFLLVLFVSCLNAQVSNDCTTATPICRNTPITGGVNGFGIDDFGGASSSGCLEETATGVIESNSAWYTFKTNASGQLGFNIGHDSLEDWDFALYLAEDCADLGDPIRCNFFDNSDENQFIGVGEDPTGATTSLQYEDWLTVTSGETYYLLINNFSSSDSGFTIQFTGDIFTTNPNDALDCSIISNLLGAPLVACENETITLDATASNGISYRWFSDTGNGFQEIIGETNSTLVVNTEASYRVEAVVSATETIISDVWVAFSQLPIAQPISDEVSCASEDVPYNLGQKDIEVLGTQDPSAFAVSYYSSLIDAQAGTNELPKLYFKAEGIETIYVRVNSLENPNCFDASQDFELNGIAVPVLGIDETIFICENGSSATIGETIANPNFEYSWNTGEQTASITISEPGEYILTATNSLDNVFCVRTRTIEVVTSISPVISAVDIEGFSLSATVTVMTEVNADYEYRIDDGDFQSEPVFEDVLPGNHTVFVRDLNGCGVVSEEIAVVGYFAYFSPNGDGIKDEWRIEGLEHLNNPEVTIYDRQGKLVKQINLNNQSWDGTLLGQELPESDYWFRLTYIDDAGTTITDKFLQKHFTLRR